MLDAFVLDVRYVDESRRRHVLVPMVNGVDLPDIIQPIQADRRKAGELVEMYAGLMDVSAGRIRDYYLGRPGRGFQADGGKVAVLGCACGITECGPFRVRITTSVSTVRWDSFGERREDLAFTFGRAAYEAELQRAVERLAYG